MTSLQPGGKNRADRGMLTVFMRSTSGTLQLLLYRSNLDVSVDTIPDLMEPGFLPLVPYPVSAFASLLP